MNIARVSIQRPIFITCIFLLILIMGYISMKGLPVDLFPDVTFPVITVDTRYPGASPREVETLISKPLEDEISTISGIKTLRSVNREGLSTVIVEFTLETDIRDAEQQVRNHVALARHKLPEDAEEAVIYRLDPSSLPIMQVSLAAPLSEGELYDLADEVIAPQIQQVPQVGLVEILGGRKREIHVKLDMRKLKEYEISASQVSQKIAETGKNIPIGKVDESSAEQVYRLVGEFPTIESIREAVVSFTGNDVPVTVADLAQVVDTLEDEPNRTSVNGGKALLLNIYKQSKSNTVAVSQGVRKRIDKIMANPSVGGKTFELKVVQDSSKMIRDNIVDVRESIFLGIILTVVVVFFFLGNFRSTVITGIALPNSLLGAFILMAWAGFSFNMMTLLGLSLAVGLLIDDAIVVRENIFRHMEMGKKPAVAAVEGTKEVLLAVIATTATVLAVFGPIAFLKGMVGQFFRQFGLTICFAMAISLFDAITMAPMLSAYFAGDPHAANKRRPILKPVYFLLDAFGRLQDRMEDFYARHLQKVIDRPLRYLGLSFLIFIACMATTAFIPKTFLPPEDNGEFMVKLEMSPGTSLPRMGEVAARVEEAVRMNKEVATTILTVGDKSGQANIASLYIYMVPSKQREMNTSEFKDVVRRQMKQFAEADPKVTDIDVIGAGMRPFNLNIIGADLEVLEKFSAQVYDRLKNHPALQDPDISHKPGKPEIQLAIRDEDVRNFGLSSDQVGEEARVLIEGSLPAVYREAGREYDIRVRAQEDQRNLKESFDSILVPNINQTLVPLSQVASLVDATSPVTINRENRSRYIRIAGDIAPGSVGMGGLINDIRKMFAEDLPPPPGISYAFVGQAEDFQELLTNMVLSLFLGVIFIYLVLSSLYESFITPFTIMLVLPLAACGAFVALFVTQNSLDIYSMIGCILLMGVASKNSILLVDYANQMLEQGHSRAEAVLLAGKNRLRPILMTSLALIAGMIPVAIGLNEASKVRVSMGVSVIGGVISSTLLTLVVIPAAFAYIDRLNAFVRGKFRRI